MAETRSEIQVGIALVAALLILVFGLMWFEDQQIGANTRPVVVQYETVGGLGVGDPVQVRGIKKGQVEQISLGDENVEVVLRLDNDVALREDSVIKIGSAGIMGERMIAIEPGSGPEVGPDHVFTGKYESATTDLVGQMDEFSDAVLAVLARADSLMAAMSQDDRLARAVESAAAATGSLNEVMTENREDLRRIARNTAELTGRMDRFLTEHADDLSAGAQGMARAAAALDTLSGQLGGVLADTQVVLDALKEQKGPAGRMIFDEQAGENLVQTLEKLRFLVEDLQRNPQRYLTVEIF